MSELITVRIQLGVSNPTRWKNSVSSESTVDEFRQLIRQDQNMNPSFGIVLIWNGTKLKNPDATLEELGVCNDSLIICIISKNTGREIEALFGDKEWEKKDQDLGIACEIEFTTRPFGFSVWANEIGNNAIVTKISKRSTIDKGVKLGYCVFKIDDTVVLGWRHKEVLNFLKKSECPVRVQFIDCGLELTLMFESKPLGFTVVSDKERANAKVWKTEELSAKRGLKIGYYIVSVNDEPVFGRLHKEICGVINNSKFPKKITFRKPPKLQTWNSKNTLFGRKNGNLTKSTKNLFGWGLKS